MQPEKAPELFRTESAPSRRNEHFQNSRVSNLLATKNDLYRLTLVNVSINAKSTAESGEKQTKAVKNM